MHESNESREAPRAQLPVSRLSGNVLDRFETARPFLLRQFRADVEAADLAPGIEVDVSSGPVQTPSVEGVPAVIRLHEPFLQYLWAIAFALVVLDQEGHRRRQVGVPPHPSPDVRRRLLLTAEDVFTWALAARTSELRWPRGCPRPGEAIPGDEIDYVGKANGLFMNAAVYVLLHEYAHVTLRHLNQVSGLDPESQIVLEVDADVFARGTLLDPDVDAGDDLSRRGGIVVAHCAMLMLAVERDADRERTGSSRLKQTQHPDLDDRLRQALEALDPEEVGLHDVLWTMAGCALHLFLVESGRSPNDSEVKTAKGWVEQLLDDVEALKRGDED